MRKTFITVLLALSAVPMLAQRVVVADKLDLGQVQFYNPAEGVFELVNDTDQPIVIDRVDTGCGCTKAIYPKTTIAPGQRYAIEVIYDARTMGHFNRIIDVFTNGNEEEPMHLSLSGQVVKKVNEKKYAVSGNSRKRNDSSVEAEETQMLPEKLGDLYADCNAIVFDDVHIGEAFQQRFQICNPTDETVQPQLMHLPSYLSANISPSKLRPGQTAEVTVVFDSNNGVSEGDIGLLQNEIYLGKNPGDVVSADKKIVVSAVVTPSIASGEMADLTNAPKIALSQNVILAKIKKGKSKTANITVTNEGPTALEIKRIQTFTPGLTVSLDNNNIEPGQTAKMKVKVNPKLFAGLGTAPRILLVTNDPENPTVFIYIKDEN